MLLENWTVCIALEEIGLMAVARLTLAAADHDFDGVVRLLAGSFESVDRLFQLEAAGHQLLDVAPSGCHHLESDWIAETNKQRVVN